MRWLPRQPGIFMHAHPIRQCGLAIFATAGFTTRSRGQKRAAQQVLKRLQCHPPRRRLCLAEGVRAAASRSSRTIVPTASRETAAWPRRRGSSRSATPTPVDADGSASSRPLPDRASANGPCSCTWCPRPRRSFKAGTCCSRPTVCRWQWGLPLVNARRPWFAPLRVRAGSASRRLRAEAGRRDRSRRHPVADRRHHGSAMLRGTGAPCPAGTGCGDAESPTASRQDRHSRRRAARRSGLISGRRLWVNAGLGQIRWQGPPPADPVRARIQAPYETRQNGCLALARFGARTTLRTISSAGRQSACQPSHGHQLLEFSGLAGHRLRAKTIGVDAGEGGTARVSQHPLLRTVGIDRSYYSPVPADDLLRYAEQLPERFPCCAKAPAAVTVPTLQGMGRHSANPDFLSASRFITDMVEPFARSFRRHLGPFILQFSPPPRIPIDRSVRVHREPRPIPGAGAPRVFVTPLRSAIGGRCAGRIAMCCSAIDVWPRLQLLVGHAAACRAGEHDTARVAAFRHGAPAVEPGTWVRGTASGVRAL